MVLFIHTRYVFTPCKFCSHQQDFICIMKFLYSQSPISDHTLQTWFTPSQPWQLPIQLTHSLPVSLWVWVSFVFGVTLRRHDASLEWELTWFSVKFVPNSMKYSISVWINLFLMWICPINGMNLQIWMWTVLVWCELYSFGVITWAWCELHLMVWIIKNKVKHTFLVWTQIYGVNQSCWYESTSWMWIMPYGMNWHVEFKTHLVWYDQHFMGMNKDFIEIWREFIPNAPVFTPKYGMIFAHVFSWCWTRSSSHGCLSLCLALVLMDLHPCHQTASHLACTRPTDRLLINRTRPTGCWSQSSISVDQAFVTTCASTDTMARHSQDTEDEITEADNTVDVATFGSVGCHFNFTYRNTTGNPLCPPMKHTRALYATLWWWYGMLFSYKQHLHLPCTTPKNHLSGLNITKNLNAPSRSVTNLCQQKKKPTSQLCVG